jgi:hypothetical protein
MNIGLPTPRERVKRSEKLKSQEMRTRTWRIIELFPTDGMEDGGKLGPSQLPRVTPHCIHECGGTLEFGGT